MPTAGLLKTESNRAASSGATLLKSEHDYVLTEKDFSRIRALIYRLAGISLTEAKHDMVYGRLSRRLRATGENSFAHYLDRVEAGDPVETEAFVNALTTNLTSFFREEHHFKTLKEQIQEHRAEGRPFRIWCCAASTGEEPYSLAITAMEAFGSLAPHVTILASDIDTNVLRTARAGVYSHDRIENLSKDYLHRYFQKGTGAQEGQVRVRPELQRLITFRRINLLESNWAITGPLDAIFCRNVMIYFDKPTQYKLLERFTPLLREDGRLYVGHSESFLYASNLLRPIGRTVYGRAPAKG